MVRKLRGYLFNFLQDAKANQRQSLPVLMPGDKVPKFIALPCPCEPRRDEKIGGGGSGGSGGGGGCGGGGGGGDASKPPVKPPRLAVPLY